MTHGSTFSGIGAAEVAADMLGWENMFHCEINPFGRKVLDYYYPKAESYEDITKTDFSKWRGKIDILTGGFPCQPFSIAGKRRGSQDDRFLWPYMLKCIQEIRPTWFIGENVAGISTVVLPGEDVKVGSGGTLFEETDYMARDERFVIEEICQQLEDCGYSVQPMLVPACAVGAPHRRDRVFFIARRKDSASDSSDERRYGMLRTSGEERTFRATSGHGETLFGEGHRVEIHANSERTRGDGSTSNSDVQRPKERYAPEEPGEKKRLDSEEDFNRRNSEHSYNGDAPDAMRSRCDRENESGGSEGKERLRLWRDVAGYDSSYMRRRWERFPTVSPVCRGNDGIPFSLDNLTISFAEWRRESLKAYGNAIVVQVIYEIFKTINSLE